MKHCILSLAMLLLALATPANAELFNRRNSLDQHQAAVAAPQGPSPILLDGPAGMHGSAGMYGPGPGLFGQPWMGGQAGMPLGHTFFQPAVSCCSGLWDGFCPGKAKKFCPQSRPGLGHAPKCTSPLFQPKCKSPLFQPKCPKTLPHLQAGLLARPCLSRPIFQKACQGHGCGWMPGLGKRGCGLQPALFGKQGCGCASLPFSVAPGHRFPGEFPGEPPLPPVTEEPSLDPPPASPLEASENRSARDWLLPHSLTLLPLGMES